MPSLSEIISARRERVLQSYNSAKATNYQLFLEDNDKATSEYIFPNQMEDAMNIVDKFYKNNRRVISIQKKTKVGADGLMIEIAKLLTTHIDDTFVVNFANVRIITGMSNAGWEKDMKDKAPDCFKDKIFHHGKLSRTELQSITNGLIIIDEIDTGDKECQVLHNTLKKAGVLDVENMKLHNNRFVFISATMIRELYDMYKWGDLHELYKMSIPSSYFGHKDFLDKGIVQEFYPLDTLENVEKWIHEDILTRYDTDYRVHIVRVSVKSIGVIQQVCMRKGITFKNHTSTDRLSDEEIKEFFKEPLNHHIVLGVKGFFRRANLIPNRWKIRIGATHELYTEVVDNNVQIQGLTGRMTGYWRDVIESGHKTGPHRTSIKAIEEYEKTYTDPFGKNSYQTAGFKKRKGKVTSNSTMLSPKNIPNLVAIENSDDENNRNKDDPRKTVPQVYKLTTEAYNRISTAGSRKEEVMRYIETHNPTFAHELRQSTCGQAGIVEPTEQGTGISKFIQPCLKRNREQKTYVTNLLKEEKKYNTWVGFLDKSGSHLIIVYYKGALQTSHSK